MSLEARIRRQLARNGLEGIELALEPGAIVTRGEVERSADRQRLRFVIESLTPDRRHIDRTTVRE